MEQKLLLMVIFCIVQDAHNPIMGKHFIKEESTYLIEEIDDLETPSDSEDEDFDQQILTHGALTRIAISPILTQEIEILQRLIILREHLPFFEN